MVELQKSTKLPSKEELIAHLNNKNLPKHLRDKIVIQNRKLVRDGDILKIETENESYSYIQETKPFYDSNFLIT